MRLQYMLLLLHRKPLWSGAGSAAKGSLNIVAIHYNLPETCTPFKTGESLTQAVYPDPRIRGSVMTNALLAHLQTFPFAHFTLRALISQEPACLATFVHILPYTVSSMQCVLCQYRLNKKLT